MLCPAIAVDNQPRKIDFQNMAEKYTALLSRLERADPDPAYLLVGDNYYQRFLITEMVLSKRIAPGQRAYSKYDISGAKASPQVLEDAFRAVPLLGGNRVIVVTDINRVPKKSQDFLIELLRLMDASVSFIGTTRRLDRRTSWAKKLIKACTHVELKEIGNQQLPSYVKSRFATRGLSLEESAVTEFCRVVGRDCGDIENEVEKMSIAFADRKRLNLDDIQKYMSRARVYSRYEVGEYWADRKLYMTLRSFQQVLAAGGSEFRSLYWACYQKFEKLLLYRQMADKLPPEALAGKLRSHIYFLKDYGRQSKKWSAVEALATLGEIYQASVAERFSRESHQQIWERALIKSLTESSRE
jgi:DNA polymerase III delta subunit